MARLIEKALSGETTDKTPLWMMRQAGRYLPEYKATRAEAGSFLDLCYTPEFAVEVTMQPIRRFGFDAAILFSDILVIPDALGRSVRFVEGEGPQLDPINAEEIQYLDQEKMLDHLKPVFETVSGIRSNLDDDKTLLGFCGAPWTVATYMIAGKGTADQAPARIFAMRHPEEFRKLLDILADVSAKYLVAQIDAGADAVQIFDTWAGILGPFDFERFVIAPISKIVRQVKEERPDAKIIGFPRGAGLHYATFAEKTGVDAVGTDWMLPIEFIRDEVQPKSCVQGNLDPLSLIVGGERLDREIDTILQNLSDGPHIFNLGHGITPKTPIEHVERMVERVRSFVK